MLTFGVDCGPVPNKADLKSLFDAITDRLKRLYDIWWRGRLPKFGLKAKGKKGGKWFPANAKFANLARWTASANWSRQRKTLSRGDSQQGCSIGGFEQTNREGKMKCEFSWLCSSFSPLFTSGT
jgi:hypothetical protein